MTLLADPVAPASPAGGGRPWWRRLWDAPAWAHLAAAAVILLLLVPVVGTSSSFLADEGAAVIQGRSLASGHGWIVPSPSAALDPHGDDYPLVNAARGSRGFAPLAKHPAYALLVAGADRLGGVAGMVLLSVAGTVLSAGLAAALARRLDPRLVRPTIWVVALASPLLFDGFLVQGHTLGAALAVAAVLAAVVAVAEDRPLVALGVGPAMAGAVLLRNEALLFAGALSAVAAVVAVCRRDGRRPAGVVAAAALVGAGVAHVGEAAWVSHIVGRASTGVAAPVPAAAEGFLRGRLDGFVLTWLGPGYGVSPALGLCLLVMLAAIALGALGARFAPSNRARVLGPAVVAAGAAVGALVLAPTNVVPGLLLAFPLAIAGILVLRRDVFVGVTPVLATATGAVFALAVLATQYPTGGTGEWGGRYFALALPVVVPVLLLALHRQGRALEPVLRRGCAAALVVCSVALAVMSVVALRANHQEKGRLVASIEAAEAVAGPGAPVVTTWSAAPRFAWSIFDRTPWLRVDSGAVGTLRQRLTGAGVDRFVFVTSDVDADRPQLGGLDVVWQAEPMGRGRSVLVVEPAEASR